ncbi:MAG: DUF4870 domain-containing protein [Verrucomicrobiota bacterium JB023]|nr:DUF4870 domain-containing protein [Verrucomicrobiota bacterium JB023]
MNNNPGTNIPQPPPGLPTQLAANSINSEERTMGMLCHLLGLLTGFLGPLILWLVKKDESAFVNAHGKESLNFAISVAIYAIVFVSILSVVGIVTFGLGFIFLMPLWAAFMIAVLIFQIQACVAANKGEMYRYPLTIRLIP